MNSRIEQHFEEIELRLIESSVVKRYAYIRQEVAPTDGKVRIKVTLIDGSMLELFEYVTASSDVITLVKYSFHWQDRQGMLRRRWDNAPHHPELPGLPHHVHLNDDVVQGVQPMPNFFDILREIEEIIGQEL